MEVISKPSITRLARRSGVKSVSEDCFDYIRLIINEFLDEIVQVSLVANSEHQTKTLMPDDVYNAFTLLDQNITQSTDFGVSTYK